MAAQNAEAKFDKTQVVKCKSCGADMYFDIAVGQLRCPYCDTTEGIAANVFENERSLDSFKEEELKHDADSITYQCPNCHAKTVMHNKFATSATCPFCGATNILATDDIPGLAPDAILPFKVTKEQASANSLKWVKKRIFAPIKLKKSFKPENLNSLYAPSFTFDSQTYSSYDGRLGKHYTETVGSGQNRRTVTKTRYFDVRGSYSMDFDDVLIEVSPTLTQEQIDKIGAFDTVNAVDYTNEYIAGHMSERYDVGVNDAYNRAKEKMSKQIRSGILAKYDYDVVDYLHINTNYKGSTFKQILVPLWCSGFKYRDKLYNYFVNGRTGRVGGKTPVAIWKVALVVIAIAALVVGIYFGVYR